MNPRTRSWLAIVALLAIPCAADAQQRNDPAFSTRIARPAHDGRTRFAVDASHENVFVVHTDRLDPLVALITADGAAVDTIPKGLDSGALARSDVLLIFTARGPFDGDDEAATRSPFTPAELEAVRRFVEDGGGLLFCVDHTPFGAAGMELAATFGVRLVPGIVADTFTSGAWQPGVYNSPIYARRKDGLAEHPIIDGRRPEEAVASVAVFGGISMEPPDGAVALLRVSPTAYNSGERGTPMNGLGAAQAIALEYGEGRVVVTGDCSMWTAQILDPDGRKLRFGMARRELDNRQFALNVLRWLSGAID